MVDAVIPARSASCASDSPRSKRACRSRARTRSSIAISATRLAAAQRPDNLRPMQIDVPGGAHQRGDRRRRAAGAARPRLPGRRVGVAPPAPRARRRRVPRGRDRRPRLRRLLRPRRRRGLPDARARRRQRRGRCARSAPTPRWSSATTGAPRSPRRPPSCAPDLFTAVALLGVPYPPRSATPADSSRADFYVAHFQGPARAGRDRGRRRAAGCAASTPRSPPAPRAGSATRCTCRDAPLPAWVEDFDAIVAAFERNGFAGPLNRYRNFAPRLGGPGRVRRAAVAVDLHHRRARQHAAVDARRRHRDRRLRPLGPAGTPGRGQRGAARVPAARAMRSTQSSSDSAVESSIEVEHAGLARVERRRGPRGTRGGSGRRD